MSLFFSTLLVGAILFFSGLALLSKHSIVTSLLKGFPRSTTATTLLFGAASLWFLYNVWHLSAADFGEYRKLLFCIFSLVAVLSFIYVPDFLAVRGLAALILLAAGPILASAYMHYELPQRLPLVGVTFLLICLSLWLGAQPYRLRDFIEWLLRGQSRSRFLGACTAAYGLLLIGLSFTY